MVGGAAGGRAICVVEGTGAGGGDDEPGVFVGFALGAGAGGGGDGPAAGGGEGGDVGGGESEGHGRVTTGCGGRGRGVPRPYNEGMALGGDAMVGGAAGGRAICVVEGTALRSPDVVVGGTFSQSPWQKPRPYDADR